MTIITAVQKDGQIAIACDTQSTQSNHALKYTAEFKINHNKLIHFGDSILGLTGFCAINQIIEDLLSQAEPSAWSSRSDIFRWFLSHHEVLKSKYFLKPDIGNGRGQIAETHWSSALIINPHGIFGIGDSREVIEYSKFWAIGSGQDFALGALDNLYDQNLPASKIAQLAAITATKFNPGCAPPIYIETIPLAKPSKAKSKRKKRGDSKKQKQSA